MTIINITFDTDQSIHIDLNHNYFVNKWVSLLEKEIKTKQVLQIDTYSSLMSEEECRRHLRNAIEVVNNFLKTEFIKFPSDIDLDSGHDYFNYLHTKFEELSGPDWENPTRLILVAPDPIKIAIKHINRFCHCLENKQQKTNQIFRIEFDTTVRESLDESDYNLFTDHFQSNFVYLDYSTLGKSLLECYIDGLLPTYQANKSQRHYAANFVMWLDKTSSDPNEYSKFYRWLEDNNIDPKTVKGEGMIPLGKLREDNSLDILKNSSKIVNITLE